MKTFLVVFFLIRIYSCSCRNNGHRIHYGKKITSQLNAPFMAGLFKTQVTGDREYVCGGTIISINQVLTSGFCAL